MAGEKFALFYCVCSIFVLESLCTCRTYRDQHPPPPTLKPKTLLNQDSPSPTSPTTGPPLPPLPVYFSLSLFLFLSLSLFSRFLTMPWRQVAWRMPGLKQYTVVRVTLSIEVCMLLGLYNRERHTVVLFATTSENMHEPSGECKSVLHKWLTV